MRSMGFALTTQQILDKTKTVTRRMGGGDLKVGYLLQPVKKRSGLKKGEKIEKLGAPIKITHIRREQLKEITQEDCVLEGFPEMTPQDFIEKFCKANSVNPSVHVTRIQFEYT